MGNYFYNFGKWFLIKIDNFTNLNAYTILVLKIFFYKRKVTFKTSLRVLFKQILFTGVEALPLIGMVSLAIGGISIIQSLTFLPKFGGESLIGKLLVTVMVRELGPLLTGFIVMGRSGTAITAEIGNMVVSHEIQALEAMGIDPIRYLVIPRILGVTISLVSLNIYFIILSILGGFLVSKMVLVTSISIFLKKILESMVLSDITVNLLKGFIFGLLISVICTFEGFAVKLSSTEVPQRTTKAMVNVITALFISDGIITVIYYI